MTERKKSCHNCVYWLPVSSDSGACRRYPPTAAFGSGKVGERPWGEWPETTNGAWCGEHTLKCFIVDCEGCFERNGLDQ